MSLPRLLVTGASGFIGRHALQILRERFHILGVGRRSQAEVGIEPHANIEWFQVDIGDCEPLTEMFHRFRDDGGVQVVLHLAAHYDFTGEDHPEYWRTNVEGLRNVLDLSRALNPDLFIFASSVAACDFPPPGRALNEASPANGDHVYAKTKRIGEEMLRQYHNDFKCCVVRFGALFSDWCEYPPLYVFLETWLSRQWNRAILGGRGESAIPYLHVRDAGWFLNALIDHARTIEPNEVFICSTDGSVSHQDLYDAGTAYWYGASRRAVHMPKLLCFPGMWFLDVAGRLLGSRPFERPWMARYIDLKLSVDASRTRSRLGWAPRERLEILRRVPFLLENMRTDPLEWSRRNHEAMEIGWLRPRIRLYYMLDRARPEIATGLTEFLTGPEAQKRLGSYRRVSVEDHAWHHNLIMQSLMTAIRTRDKAVFMAYCSELAERRFRQRFPKEQVIAALDAFHEITVATLKRQGTPDDVMVQAINDYITSTTRFGIDKVQDVYDRLEFASHQLPYQSSRLSE